MCVYDTIQFDLGLTKFIPINGQLQSIPFVIEIISVNHWAIYNIFLKYLLSTIESMFNFKILKRKNCYELYNNYNTKK